MNIDISSKLKEMRKKFLEKIRNLGLLIFFK